MTQPFSIHEPYYKGDKATYNGNTWTYSPLPIGSILSIGLSPSKFNRWYKD